LHDTYLIVKILVEILDRLHIPYLIGGSVASSIHGVFRYTHDVDFVVQISQQDIAPFVDALKEDFYVDEEMIEEALAYRSSFAVLQAERLDYAYIRHWASSLGLSELLEKAIGMSHGG
jgi:hypothetical protein